MTDYAGKFCKQLSNGIFSEHLAIGPDVSGQLA